MLLSMSIASPSGVLLWGDVSSRWLSGPLLPNRMPLGAPKLLPPDFPLPEPPVSHRGETEGGVPGPMWKGRWWLGPAWSSR